MSSDSGLRLPLQPDLVVTRYPALVEAARLCGLDPSVPVRSGVRATDVIDKIVLGSLPLRLMARAKAVLTADFNLSANETVERMTGRELLERITAWRVYVVRTVSNKAVMDEILAGRRPQVLGCEDKRRAEPRIPEHPSKVTLPSTGKRGKLFLRASAGRLFVR